MGAQSETGGGEQYSGGDVVIPLQKEQPSVATQRVDQGSVRIRKFVTTETVNAPVQVREETVSVDRVPAGASQGNANTALNTPFQGGEITIPLMKEQPVVSTQVVPNGAVVIHKQETTQQVNVPAQVRSEGAVAEPIGNPQNVTISGDLRGEPGAQGSPGSAYGQTSGAGGQPITQWSQLYNQSDVTALYNQPVNISSAKIDQVLNNQLVQVSADNGTKFFVHIDQPVQGLQAGQTIALNGTIKQVPSDTSTLGWDQASAQAVQGQQFAIDVPTVTPQ